MADGLPLFDLGEKDCRVIADGLASLWAVRQNKDASKQELKYIDQLGVLFESYAPPRKRSKKLHQRVRQASIGAKTT